MWLAANRKYDVSSEQLTIKLSDHACTWQTKSQYQISKSDLSMSYSCQDLLKTLGSQGWSSLTSRLYQAGYPGDTPKSIGWRCGGHFPKPLPYLRPKSAIFPTLFMT